MSVVATIFIAHGDGEKTSELKEKSQFLNKTTPQTVKNKETRKLKKSVMNLRQFGNLSMDG